MCIREGSGVGRLKVLISVLALVAVNAGTPVLWALQKGSGVVTSTRLPYIGTSNFVANAGVMPVLASTKGGSIGTGVLAIVSSVVAGVMR